MLGCSSTILCVMYLFSEKLALMGRTGGTSALRTSGAGVSDGTGRRTSVVLPFVRSWVGQRVESNGSCVESNQSKVLSVMETWHCLDLYLNVQDTARAAQKGRNYWGVEGTAPRHHCSAQCRVFERGSAKTTDLVSTKPIQSHPQPLHHP